MKWTRTDGHGETQLRIEGALDALTAPDLRPVIDGVVDEGRSRVTVDLTRATRLDSSGVGALVALWRRVRGRGGDVRVVGLHDQPLAVMRLLKLDRVLTVEATT